MGNNIRILIWGTGNIARTICENGIYGEILGFIETQKNKETWRGYLVYDIETMPKEYDFILVANTFSDEIYELCNKLSFDLSKIVFLKRGKYISYNDSRKIREILGEKNYTDYAVEFGTWKSTFFEDDMNIYRSLNRRQTFGINENYLRPILMDKYVSNGGGGVSTYLLHDLWAAKHIILSGTKEHFDIGSRVDGFITHLLAADIKVTMIDIRPFPGAEIIDNLYSIIDNATLLEQFEDNSISSLSAISSLEHFGLGRYGDPIDPEACFKCFEKMQQKLKKNGKLYLSVPIGSERLEFNAHRIFNASTIVSSFNKLRLKEYSVVVNKRLEFQVDIERYDSQDKGYVMGLFLFEK